MHASERGRGSTLPPLLRLLGWKHERPKRTRPGGRARFGGVSTMHRTGVPGVRRCASRGCCCATTMYWARTIWETSVRALVGAERRFERPAGSGGPIDVLHRWLKGTHQRSESMACGKPARRAAPKGVDQGLECRLGLQGEDQFAFHHPAPNRPNVGPFGAGVRVVAGLRSGTSVRGRAGVVEQAGN